MKSLSIQIINKTLPKRLLILGGVVNYLIMTKKFYCKICNSEFPKKQLAKRCKKTHLKINIKVNLITVMEIFNSFFSVVIQNGKQSNIYKTNETLSFEEFFINKVIEAYKNSTNNL